MQQGTSEALRVLRDLIADGQVLAERCPEDVHDSIQFLFDIGALGEINTAVGRVVRVLKPSFVKHYAESIAGKASPLAGHISEVVIGRYIGPGPFLVTAADGTQTDLAEPMSVLGIVAIPLSDGTPLPVHIGKIGVATSLQLLGSDRWPGQGYTLVLLAGDSITPRLDRWIKALDAAA